MTDIISQLISLWDIKSKHLGSLSSQEAPEGCFDAGKDIDFTTVVRFLVVSTRPDKRLTFFPSSAQDIISRLAFGESYRQLESTLDLLTSSSSPPLPRPTPSKPTTFPYRTSPLAKASKLFFDVSYVLFPFSTFFMKTDFRSTRRFPRPLLSPSPPSLLPPTKSTSSTPSSLLPIETLETPSTLSSTTRSPMLEPERESEREGGAC